MDWPAGDVPEDLWESSSELEAVPGDGLAEAAGEELDSDDEWETGLADEQLANGERETAGPAEPFAAARPVEPPRPSGDERVDEALSRLTDLPELPIADHPAVFTHVHQRLNDALGDLGAHDDPGTPGY